jgi:hypothetical protein
MTEQMHLPPFLLTGWPAAAACGSQAAACFNSKSEAFWVNWVYHRCFCDSGIDLCFWCETAQQSQLQCEVSSHS